MRGYTRSVLIEIRMVEFVNKGQELMLHATLRRLQQAYPEADFTMAPSALAPFRPRAELGLRQKAWLWRYGIQWGGLAGLAPPRLREYYGVVLDREVDVVIDAAGFLYTDMWSPRPAEELAHSCRRWHRRGTKIILAPQAFGPFTSRRLQNAIRTIVDHTDLIFARDPVSYQHLIDLVGERPHIQMAPDFTGLIDGIVPDDFEPAPGRCSIVPNYRMVDKTSRTQSDAYLPFMIRCVQYLRQQGVSPFLLVHSGPSDLKLAEHIRAAVGGDVPIVKQGHPLKIKGILGQCESSIGSRFHGLVSALNQGVPALAAGWSHKYQMLFDDYGFGEGMMDTRDSNEEMRKRIALLTDPDSRAGIRSNLLAKAQTQSERAEAMWQQVFDVIDGSAGSGTRPDRAPAIRHSA